MIIHQLGYWCCFEMSSDTQDHSGVFFGNWTFVGTEPLFAFSFAEHQRFAAQRVADAHHADAVVDAMPLGINLFGSGHTEEAQKDWDSFDGEESARLRTRAHTCASARLRARVFTCA